MDLRIPGSPKPVTTDEIKATEAVPLPSETTTSIKMSQEFTTQPPKIMESTELIKRGNLEPTTPPAKLSEEINPENRLEQTEPRIEEQAENDDDEDYAIPEMNDTDGDEEDEHEDVPEVDGNMEEEGDEGRDNINPEWRMSRDFEENTEDREARVEIIREDEEDVPNENDVLEPVDDEEVVNEIIEVPENAEEPPESGEYDDGQLENRAENEKEIEADLEQQERNKMMKLTIVRSTPVLRFLFMSPMKQRMRSPLMQMRSRMYDHRPMMYDDREFNPFSMRSSRYDSFGRFNNFRKSKYFNDHWFTDIKRNFDFRPWNSRPQKPSRSRPGISFTQVFVNRPAYGPDRKPGYVSRSNSPAVHPFHEKGFDMDYHKSPYQTITVRRKEYHPNYISNHVEVVSHLKPKVDREATEEEPGSSCLHRMSVAPCRINLPFWYFDQRSGQCKIFLYGGCPQTQNKFETKEKCMATCLGMYLVFIKYKFSTVISL